MPLRSVKQCLSSLLFKIINAETAKIIILIAVTMSGFTEKECMQEYVRSPGGGGGGYSINPWVGRCGATPHTLTLLETNIVDFPTLLKTE